jgi:hypothetical protein
MPASIQKVVVLDRRDSLPDPVEPGVAYVSRNADDEWAWLEFACPCGRPHCWESVPLDRRWAKEKGLPCWSLTINEQGLPSLSPSVSHHSKCRVHYSLVAGEFFLYPFNR